jgi:hypothetical protein
VNIGDISIVNGLINQLITGGHHQRHRGTVKGSGSSAMMEAAFTAWPGSKVPAPKLVTPGTNT